MLKELGRSGEDGGGEISISTEMEAQKSRIVRKENRVTIQMMQTYGCRGAGRQGRGQRCDRTLHGQNFLAFATENRRDGKVLARGRCNSTVSRLC